MRRILKLLILASGSLLIVSGCAPASAPDAAKPAAQAAPAAAAAPAPNANLAQLMRGILFPNSNVIFYVQDKDPTKVKPAPDPALSTDPLASTYGGWAAVENSGLALAEGASLLNVPGRKCSNGRAVPVESPDWRKFVKELEDAGMTAYKAAQSKNQDTMLMAADAMTTACSNCHDKYREKPGGVPDRCM